MCRPSTRSEVVELLGVKSKAKRCLETRTEELTIACKPIRREI